MRERVPRYTCNETTTANPKEGHDLVFPISTADGIDKATTHEDAKADRKTAAKLARTNTVDHDGRLERSIEVVRSSESWTRDDESR